MWGAIIKWSKWSDMIDVRLPEVIFWDIIEKYIVNNSISMGGNSSWLDNVR